MVKNERGVIVEATSEARRAKRGPWVLIVLTVSVIDAVVAMAVVWFVFPEAILFLARE
jgi:hypothetical protein